MGIFGNTCFRSTRSLITPVKYICTESKVLSLLIYNASFLWTHLGAPENEWIACVFLMEIPSSSPHQHRFQVVGALLHAHSGLCCPAGFTAFRVTVCGQFTFCISTAKPTFCSTDQLRTVTSVSRSTQFNYKKTTKL